MTIAATCVDDSFECSERFNTVHVALLQQPEHRVVESAARRRPDLPDGLRLHAVLREDERLLLERRQLVTAAEAMPEVRRLGRHPLVPADAQRRVVRVGCHSDAPEGILHAQTRYGEGHGERTWHRSHAHTTSNINSQVDGQREWWRIQRDVVTEPEGDTETTSWRVTKRKVENVYESVCVREGEIERKRETEKQRNRETEKQRNRETER